MKRIALVIAYDGTAYAGWQRQENALSVQEIIEGALSEVMGHAVLLRCAGRTDAGVHAEGQVADFETAASIPPEKIFLPLNNRLPEDIRIVRSCEMRPDFSARFCARWKHYRYRLYTGAVLPPRYARFCAQHTMPLSLASMRDAARRMEGTHDFKAFEGPYAQMAHTTRRILRIDMHQRESEIVFDIYGEAFLKNMVRIMVGTLVKVGEGKMTPKDIDGLFASLDRTHAGVTMPAKGLTMVRIAYAPQDEEALYPQGSSQLPYGALSLTGGR